ncbi:acyltransferase [Knoellia aerolata]|uniref:Acyltransferase 3 domain-containing protein n=1 Tax=Knoellia aerolata DSM 18566 TaxID=1385519 RepID=A0A0A0JXV3_9MICO|nr:acyltransferase [Knoellia aerolata]KGN40902.1 hypothetical protein N801_10600 [Knoellia aerolata DSM 18566]
MTADTRRSAPLHGSTGHDASTAWISWLRVVAIAGVVTIHTVGGTASMPGARETVRGQAAILLDIGAIFAVPVFVMISGALVLDPTRYRGAQAFLRRRIWRIVVPLVVWHLWYYVLIVVVMDVPMTPKAALVAAINGNLYSALYFFWIVLGLSLIAPVLIPFIADSGAKGALVAGLGFAAIPVVTIATMRLRGVSTVLTDLAWTWWLPYLGFFLLGWACRGALLHGWSLAVVGLGSTALGFTLAWQWRNPEAPSWLQTISPVSYYSLSVLLYSTGVFVTAHSLVRPAACSRRSRGRARRRWDGSSGTPLSASSPFT